MSTSSVGDSEQGCRPDSVSGEAARGITENSWILPLSETNPLRTMQGSIPTSVKVLECTKDARTAGYVKPGYPQQNPVNRKRKPSAKDGFLSWEKEFRCRRLMKNWYDGIVNKNIRGTGRSPMIDHKTQPAPPNQIRLIRKLRGINRKALAHSFGHETTSTIGYWETGQKEPTLRNALKLQLLLHVRVDQLFPRLTWKLQSEMESEQDQLRH